MMIHVSVHEREPPTGEVVLEEDRTIPFAGWLGLLQAISDAMEAERVEKGPGRMRR